MKQTRIHCPYCGSLATLRPASAIHGLSDISAGTYLVCCAVLWGSSRSGRLDVRGHFLPFMVLIPLWGPLCVVLLWLKRIAITWAILNGLGFIMAYVTPFFQGGTWNP